MQEEQILRRRSSRNEIVTIEVDDEISFRRAGRVSLGEITNNKGLKQSEDSPKKTTSAAAKSSSGSPLGCQEDSVDSNDDDNDVTVVIDMGDLAMNNSTDMHKLPSFNVAKYTEADMAASLKKCQEQETKNLEEAVAIADRLLERSAKAEELRAEAQNALVKIKKELQLSQEELAVEKLKLAQSSEVKTELSKCMADLKEAQKALQNEKEESAMSQTQMRALAHSVNSMEIQSQAAMESHATNLAAKEEAYAQDLQRIAAKFEEDREVLKKQHTSTLSSMNEKVLQLQDELKKQSEEKDIAITDAKQKVYAKVKTQFDNGNKEFNRIKSEKDVISKELETIQVQLQAAQAKCETADEKFVSTKAKLLRLGSLYAGLLKDVLPSAQHIRVSKLFLETSIVDGSEKEMDAVQTASEQAQELLSKRTKEVMVIQAAATSLNEEVNIAKTALDERDHALQSLSSKFDTMRESFIAKQRDEELLRAELKSVQNEHEKELQAIQKEKDSLMLAVAKLSTSNTTLEMQIEEINTEKIELDSRNAGLRQMNEEMMAMLEKMHGV